MPLESISSFAARALRRARSYFNKQRAFLIDKLLPDSTPLDFLQLYTSIDALALCESGAATSGRVIAQLIEHSFQTGSITEGQKLALEVQLCAAQMRPALRAATRH